MRTWFALAVSLALPACSWAQKEVSRANDLFRGEQSAYAVWPPELVTGSEVAWAQWAPSGQRILGTRKSRDLTASFVRSMLLELPIELPPAIETTVFLWSKDDKKVKPIWQTTTPADVGMYHWIGKSDTALALVHGQSLGPDGSAVRTEALLLVEAAKGTARVVSQGSEDLKVISLIDVAASSSMPYAVVFLRSTSAEATQAGGPNGVWFAQVIRQNGAVGSPIALPAGPMAYAAYRSADATKGYIRGAARPRPEAGTKLAPVVFTWFAVDGHTGSIAPCEAPQKPVLMEDYSADQEAKEPRLRVDRTPIGTGSAARSIDSAWLYADGVPDKKGRRSAVLVAADCSRAALNSKLDSVLYIAGGSLFVRGIQRLSLGDFEAAADLQEQKTAMANAKQIAVALAIYAADNDDMFPDKDGLGDTLYPYLKDGGLMSGFVYTFGGGSASAIQDPPGTQLGYIDGPGGRAVVYADGHVKWVRS